MALDCSPELTYDMSMTTTPHAPVASPSRAAVGCLGGGVGERSLEDLFAWHEAGEVAAWVGLLETSAPVGTRGSGWTALVAKLLLPRIPD